MYTNPRPGQYLTHTQSYFTRAVAATDSCFALIGANQRGKAVGLKNGENPCLKNLLLPRRVQSSLSSASSAQSMWELLAGNRTAVLPRHARARWITSYQYIEARGHIHQPTAWPLSHACAQPHHAGNGHHGQLFRPYWSSSAWHSRWSVTRLNTFLPRRVL